MSQVSRDDHAIQMWTLIAFEAACQRMLGHAEVDHQSYAATGEALYWACTADEGYDELLGSTYKATRDRDPSGVQLKGVRWARNRMTHQRAIVVEQHYGAELDTMILDKAVLDTRSHLKWASSEGIPPGRHDAGRDIYDSRLAGKPIENVVEACRHWLFGPTLNELSIRAGLVVGDLPGLPHIDL